MSQKATHLRVLGLLDAIPRTRLAVEPTPLVQLPSLRAEVAPRGPRILAKMDAYTGFGLGGNKVRKLEYELAPQRLAGVTCLVTSGGAQSNHARVTAAAAAWLGLDCVLVLKGPEPEQVRGNALLHRLFGARIEWVEHREDRAPTMERVAADIRAHGGRPLVVPLGASTPLGALGYLRAYVEFADQLRCEQDTGGATRGRTWAFVASSSGGTLAGLHLGRALSPDLDVELIGVSADTPADELAHTVKDMAEEAKVLLRSHDVLRTSHLHTTADFVGPGYGIPTVEGGHATRLFAERAGMVLDPTYTSKAAAGLLHWIRQGRVGRDDTVVFWHTGGHPAVFV